MRKLFVLAAVIATLTACGTTVVNNPAPTPTPAVTFNSEAVTVAGCRALAQWETGPSTGTEANAGTSTIVQGIIHTSAGTQFSSDLDSWVVDLQTGDVSQAVIDSGTVDTDCAAVGILKVIGG